MNRQEYGKALIRIGNFRMAILKTGGMRGAVAVEYALCMLIAAWIMIGVQMLFENMSYDILNNFAQWVRLIP